MLGFLLKIAGYVIGTYYMIFCFVCPLFKWSNPIQKFFPHPIALNLIPLILLTIVGFLAFIIVTYMMMEKPKKNKVNNSIFLFLFDSCLTKINTNQSILLFWFRLQYSIVLFLKSLLINVNLIKKSTPKKVNPKNNLTKKTI